MGNGLRIHSHTDDEITDWAIPPQYELMPLPSLGNSFIGRDNLSHNIDFLFTPDPLIDENGGVFKVGSLTYNNLHPCHIRWDSNLAQWVEVPTDLTGATYPTRLS